MVPASCRGLLEPVAAWLLGPEWAASAEAGLPLVGLLAWAILAFAANVAANPMGRMGTPQEVANCVVFLAGTPASFVSGAHLIVDGAITNRVQF